MKKIIFLSVISCLLVTSVYGVTKLTYEQHAMKPDEDNNMVLTKYQDPGPGGINQVWNFAGMNRTNDFKGTVKIPVQLKSTVTPYNTELIEFGNSFYLNIDKDKIEMYGYSSANGHVRIEYDKPFVKMTYPFEYGNSYTGTYSGKMTTNTRESVIEGTYNVEADGYGKLILPNSIEVENTLRVKTIKSYKQDGYDIAITTYRWYAENVRYPLLVLITTESSKGQNTNKSYTAAYKENLEINSSVVNQSAVENTSIYPNPFNDKFTVDYELSSPSGVLIELYNIEGKKIATLLNENQEAGIYNPEFNAEILNLKQGVYNIKIKLNNQESVKRIIYNK